MADLYNLQAELNEPEFPLLPTAEDAEDTEEVLEDRHRVEEPEVPLALREAERKQHEQLDDSLKGDKGILDEEEELPVEDPDYAQLKRLWQQEMNCPELLPYDEDTITLQMELLESQEDSIEKLLEQASSSAPRDSSRTDPGVASIIASIYKMDADRVRFMLTDLSRTRLAKIEEHPLYMREMVDRMSEQEISYLKQYGELLEGHFHRTVLDHLPKDAWKKLDQPEMIDFPNMDQFVFCKVLETLEIDNYDPLGEEEDEDLGGSNIQEYQADSCLIARYSAIRDLVLEGKIELLL